jgi:methylated-DNA-[protein]-cysteine S-methyltransferase
MTPSLAHSTTVATPIGPFSLVVLVDTPTAPGKVPGTTTVLASGWTDDIERLTALISPALRPRCVEHRDDLGELTTVVEKYHGGDLAAVDTVTVMQRSGPFLEHAWTVLRTVGAGDPLSYAAFAARCGRPAAVRAAATACARNAVALFVPCHRIVRTDGSLGGFRWGLDVKRWLLDHESHAV